MKRLFDIGMSFLGLLVLLPLAAALAAWIKAEDGGPIFFAQIRIGRNLKPFVLYKFRSMSVAGEKKDLKITSAGNPRVTRVGRFIRKYKLDELPQLWNVLVGDMSLVGPRPEVRKYVSMHREAIKAVLRIRPGITDPASLNALDEEEELGRQADPEAYYIQSLLPRKLAISSEYARKASLTSDVLLIFQTLARIVR